MAGWQERTRADGSRVFRVTYRLDGKQTSDTFTDKKVAERHRRLVEQIGPAAARAELLEAAQGDDGRITLADWFATHLAESTNTTPGTRAEYQRLAARTWLPMLGRRSLDSITESDVRRWVNHQRTQVTRTGKPTSGKTLRNAHGLLSTVLGSAARRKLITENVAKGIPLPRTESVEMVLLSETEVIRLLDCVRDVDPRYEDFVLFLVATGVRFGEATALAWNQVFLQEAVPYARISRAYKKGVGHAPVLGETKTNKGTRSVALYPDLAARLVQRRLDQIAAAKAAGRVPAPDDLVFTAARGSRIANNTFHMRVWQPAVAAFAGDITEVVWEPSGTGRRRRTVSVQPGPGKRPRVHDLRHAAATWMVHDGADTILVQNVIGHENPVTTLRTYGHNRHDALAVQAAIMGRRLAAMAPVIETGTSSRGDRSSTTALDPAP